VKSELDEIKSTLQAMQAQMGIPRQEISSIVLSCVEVLIVELETAVIAFCTESVEELFGYIPGELLGRNVNELLPDELRAKHVQHMADYAKEPTKRQMGTREMMLHGKRKDGQTIELEISLHPHAFGGRRYVVASVHRTRGEAP
jgi:PAS domain S-box-containing protein